jgi:hypothetical protein
LPSSFANLLEAVFYDFGKNPRMPSTFSKLLELLLELHAWLTMVSTSNNLVHKGDPSFSKMKGQMGHKKKYCGGLGGRQDQWPT